jgi:anti-sigma B factor antagonist
MNKSSTKVVKFVETNAMKERQPGMDGKVGMEITREGSFGIVAFKATCISDVEGIASASRQIKEFIEKNRPKRVIFDFTEVKFFSSGVLGLLLDVRAKLQLCSGEVVVSAINPQLHRVFKITNLDKIFRFFPDRVSAVKAVGTD